MKLFSLDLAALIKDKSKTIDKLEQAIKQHEEGTVLFNYPIKKKFVR